MMRESKFTLNALLLVVAIFSGILFFVTVTLSGLADTSAPNGLYPIEGTKLWVRYTRRSDNGLFDGSNTAGKMVLPGTYGYDWGAAAAGDTLYINEYTRTSLGLTLCDLVRVDLNSYEKDVVRKDATLRGRCASGELVCLAEYLMPANVPSANPLCTLYALTSPGIRTEGDGALVLFLDPVNGETVYSVWDDEALTCDFEARYLARTLEEVRG